MHSAFCSKLTYKLLVTACVDSHLAGMGGSSQVWFKMWWGRGHPIRTVQLGVRRVRELDLVDMEDRTVIEACEVYHRTGQTKKWEVLGFFHIYPQYGIPIGGDPPANGKRWTLCISNGLYYHSDRISEDLCKEYQQCKKDKAAKTERRRVEELEKERKRVEEALIQRLLRENMEEDDPEEAFVQRLLRENMEEDDPRDEDEEMDAPSLGPSCKRSRIQAGEFKFAISESVSGTNMEKQAAPMFKRPRIQRGGA